MADLLTAEVEVEESAGAAVSPAADRSAETPQYLTREEFEERFTAGLDSVATHIQGVVNKAFDGNKSHFDRAVHQIRTTLGVSQERANAILDEMAVNQGISSEQIEAVNAKVAAKTKAEEDAAEREALKAQLAAKEAERIAAEAAKVDPEYYAATESYKELWEDTKDALGDFAKAQGVSLTPHLDKLKDELKVTYAKGVGVRINNQPARVALKAFREQVKAAVKAEADAKHVEAEGRADVDTRAASGGTASKQDLVNKYAWGQTLTPEQTLAAVKAFREEGFIAQANPNRRRAS